MNSIIKMVLKYQVSKSDELFTKIVHKFNYLIEYSIADVPELYKDDVYQEIMMSLQKILLNFKINYDVLIQKEFTNVFIKKYSNNPKFQELVFNNNKNNFNYEYVLFCNENQLIKYLTKVFKSRVIDFFRKYNNETISLNSMVNETQELINFIRDESFEKINPFDNYDFTKEEKSFLELLFSDKKTTEKEVGKILGISQQAVNKRKRKIIQKHNLLTKK